MIDFMYAKFGHSQHCASLQLESIILSLKISDRPFVHLIIMEQNISLIHVTPNQEIWQSWQIIVKPGPISKHWIKILLLDMLQEEVYGKELFVSIFEVRKFQPNLPIYRTYLNLSLLREDHSTNLPRESTGNGKKHLLVYVLHKQQESLSKPILIRMDKLTGNRQSQIK